MNIEQIKLGFVDYLNDLQSKDNKDNNILDASDVSIFAYSKEFKKYLIDEFNLSSDVMYMNIDELDKLDFENGQLIDSSKQDENQDNTDVSMVDVFNLLIDDDIFKTLYDADNDGEISNEEFEIFKNSSLNEIDGNSDDISYDDIMDYFSQNGDDDENKIPETENNLEDVDVSDGEKTPVNTPSTPTGGGHSPYSSSNTNTNYNPENITSADKTVNSDDYSNKSVEELESLKSSKQSEIGEAREELNDVYSENNEDVKNAKDNEEKAKEDYLEAVKNDEQISEELKTDLEKTLDDISSKEDEIDSLKIELNDAEAKITDQEAVISDDDANISAIESTLSSLKGQTSEDPEVQAQIDANIRELEGQKAEAEAKRDADKAVLDDELIPARDDIKDNKIPKAEGELEDLVAHKNDIQDEIEKTCSQDTKEAIQTASDAYDEARQEVPKIQEEQRAAAQTKIDALQTELDKISEELNTKKANETKNKYSVSDYEFDFDYKFTGNQENDLQTFKKLFEDNKDKYQKVADETGVPAELIAAIHWRESSGNFSTYLHNGDPLGKPTTHVPKGLYFEDWTEAAIHAINKEKENFVAYRQKQDLPYNSSDFSANFKDIKCWYDYAEAYNGLGSYNKGRLSSYVWAGSDKYTCGKYVADNKYDPNYVDTQLGVAIMLKYLLS